MACQRPFVGKENDLTPLSALFSTSSSDDDPFPTYITNRRRNSRPLWIDTDVGFDDLVAIGCCVGAPADANYASTDGEKSFGGLAGISTVGGGLTSDPSDGAGILKALLPFDSEKDSPICLVKGRRSPFPQIDDPSWLATCREQMNEFCSSEGILLNSDNGDSRNQLEDAATAAIRSATTEARQKYDNREPMDLVCLGPLTNLAHWLDEIPGFASTKRLNSVWILGGNIPIPRNGDKDTVDAVEAEFNFARDPGAVRTVFTHAGWHSATVHVLPQEVCDRRAFEASFSQTPTPSAATIIDDWLESPPSPSQGSSGPQSSPEDTAYGVQAGAAADAHATVSSLLPAWMVRLIRTRTFSVYGDPICMYVRDNAQDTDCNESSEKNCIRRRPKIVWKDYSTARGNINGNHELLVVDADGRLMLDKEVHDSEGETVSNSLRTALHSPSTNAQTSGATTYRNEDNSSGITIRIAHEVELGPVYMDWLSTSLLSSSRQG